MGTLGQHPLAWLTPPLVYIYCRREEKQSGECANRTVHLCDEKGKAHIIAMHSMNKTTDGSIEKYRIMYASP